MSGENINRRLNIYINDREVVNSLGGVEREMAKVRGQMRNLVKGTDDYDKKLAELKDTYSQLKEKQADFKEEIQDTTKVMGEAREAASKIFTGLSSGNAKLAQEGLNGIKGSLLGVVKASWAFIMTPIGATLTILAGIGAITKMFVDYNEEIRQSTRLIENLSGKTGQAAADIRVGVSAIAKTFKVEFETVAKAVDNLVDTGVVKNEMKALEKIKNGLLRAPDSNEFLSSLENTSETARQLGMDLDDVIALKEAIEAKGVDPDKVFGALEKATKNLQTQTKSLRDDLSSALGAAFTDDVLKKIRTGQISINEALTLIDKKSKEVGLNMTEQQRLTSEIFGKSGIAAGGFAKILDIVTEAQNKQNEGLTPLQKNLDKLAESELASQKAQDNALNSDGYEKWKTKAILAINTVKKGFWDMFYNITNGAGADKQKIKIDAEQKAINNYTEDALKSFEDYISRRKKSMGDEFDFEKVREERLATIRAQYAKSGAGSWDDTSKSNIEIQKRLEAEIDAVKNYGKQTKSLKYSQTEEEKKAQEDAAKARAKALEDAKKHSEEIKKLYETSQKELLSTQRSFEDAYLGNQKETYEKEKVLLDLEFSRKIEDLKIKSKQEQDEIAKLQDQLGDPKNSKSDVILLKKTIENKKEIQKEYNDTILAYQETFNIKLAALQEKYINKEFQREEEENQKALQKLQTRQNLELASISTLADAKKLLQNSLSTDELEKIKTLEDAKKEITKRHLQEEYELQLEYLQKVSDQYKSLFELDYASGLSLLTDEERIKISQKLDELALKISEFKVKIKGTETSATDSASASLSGIDILGFSPQQWTDAFDSLDTWKEKIGAIGMAIGGLKNGFGMYFQFLEAGEKRNLQAFEATNRKKQKALSDQLEKGFISQEVYNAKKERLDAELAKKKANMEYKQAKRQKMMNIASIISNTALAVSKTMGETGFFGLPLAAIVAAQGAAQLAVALAQPLPSPEEFYDGGYTGDGNPKEISNALGRKPYLYHKKEYVVPHDVLFDNDPVVPKMIDYLEAKRLGRSPILDVPSSSNPSNPSGSGNQTDTALGYSIERLTDAILRLEEKDFTAYLTDDIPTAKKIRERLKQLEKIENLATK